MWLYALCLLCRPILTPQYRSAKLEDYITSASLADMVFDPAFCFNQHQGRLFALSQVLHPRTWQPATELIVA